MNDNVCTCKRVVSVSTESRPQPFCTKCGLDLEGPKRNNYFLFAGETYYPAGPNDLVGVFQTLAECYAEGERLIEDPNEHFICWYGILDVDKGRFIGTKGEWYGKT